MVSIWIETIVDNQNWHKTLYFYFSSPDFNFFTSIILCSVDHFPFEILLHGQRSIICSIRATFLFLFSFSKIEIFFEICFFFELEKNRFRILFFFGNPETSTFITLAISKCYGKVRVLFPRDNSFVSARKSHSSGVRGLVVRCLLFSPEGSCSNP